MRFFPFHRRPLDWRTRLGLVFLVFAMVVHWAVSRGTWPTSNLTDCAQGVLYGVAIGAMLLGLRAQSRCSSPDASEI